MTEQSIAIGKFTVFAWALALMLTGALFWLGVIEQSLIYTAVVWFYVVPIGLLIFLALFGGVRGSEKPVLGIVGIEALILWGLLVIDAYVWTLLVPGQFVSGNVLDHLVLGLASIESILLIGILFAIYEETFFTAIAAAMKRAGAPDVLVIAISMFVFVLLHARAYPDEFFYSLFLSLSRALLTLALLKTDNSDVPMIAHILYNITVALV